METSKGGKRIIQAVPPANHLEEDGGGEEDEDAVGGDNGKKKNKRGTSMNPSNKRRQSGSGGSSSPLRSCQVEGCNADMAEAKPYHRRHRVCEYHAKAAVVVLAGVSQRFCQQCSRFHELSEFDEAKRSCRRRLAGHNERRRKSSSYGSQ